MYRKTLENRRILIALIIIGILVITLYFREPEEGFLHDFQRVTLSLLSSIQLEVSRVASPIQNTWNYAKEIGRIHQENLKLGREVLRLREELLRAKVAEEENKRLRELVGFKKKAEFKTVATRIIGKSNSNWEDVVIIDGGSNQDLRKNMPVVTGDGVVGQIVRVAPGASQVQLITDSRSGVAARILRTGENGILEGQVDGEVTLKYINEDSPARKGDIVVTSGLGGVYPEGLYLGRVAQIRSSSSSLYKRIRVNSDVDFAKLVEVLVVVHPLPQTSLIDSLK